tara:strand:+ start:144 stop:266 length:123 start_codon:yes stop_codon:yes gene_type:complete
MAGLPQGGITLSLAYDLVGMGGELRVGLYSLYYLQKKIAT